MYNTDKQIFFLAYIAKIPPALNPLLIGLSSKNLIDVIAKSAQYHNFELSQIIPFIIISIYIFIYTMSSNLISQRIDNMQGRKYVAKFEIDLVDKVNSLDLQVFENSQNLDLLDKADKGTVNSVQFIFNATITLIRMIIQSITTGIALLFINPLIPIFVIVFNGMGVFIKNSLSINIRLLFDKLTPIRRLRNQYSRYFLRTNTITEIKLYNLYSFFRNKIYNITSDMDKEYEATIKRYRYKFALFYILDAAIAVICQIYIFLQAVYGYISIGSFSFFLSQLGGYSNAISQFGDNVSLIYNHSLNINDILKVKKLEPMINYSLSNTQLTSELIDIEFKDVSFSYPGVNHTKVFNHLNFKIDNGEKIAIVGINGAGKTTLIKLLLRFYDPDEGQILINGINLKHLDINIWYEKIGVLFQDYGKYEVSVSDNVGYGSVGNIFNRDQINSALIKSSAIEFINKYPNGIDQILGRMYEDSIDPSGGQWQKIALARAFFRDAPILILDEPTAAIDAKAEAEIFERVQQLSRKKTVIIISHRFSTVRNADRIIVIEHGKIIEQGSHNELINLNGKYEQLFALQAKGYK